jgi:hypothetical protein
MALAVANLTSSVPTSISDHIAFVLAVAPVAIPSSLVICVDVAYQSDEAVAAQSLFFMVACVSSQVFILDVFDSVVLSDAVSIFLVAVSTILSIENASADLFVGSYVDFNISPVPEPSAQSCMLKLFTVELSSVIVTVVVLPTLLVVILAIPLPSDQSCILKLLTVESSSVIVTVVVLPTLLVVILAIPLPLAPVSHLAPLKLTNLPYLILSPSVESDNNILSLSAGVTFSTNADGKIFVILYS